MVVSGVDSVHPQRKRNEGKRKSQTIVIILPWDSCLRLKLPALEPMKKHDAEQSCTVFIMLQGFLDFMKEKTPVEEPFQSILFARNE